MRKNLYRFLVYNIADEINDIKAFVNDFTNNSEKSCFLKVNY